ncbi:MAG: hemerythrin domain-containing protein [Methylococcales bacterium]|nr:hemerythrin domain-containing protein [Methylococcales bacterium]
MKKTSHTDKQRDKQREEDALMLLTEDHQEVKELFAEFAKLAESQSSAKTKAKAEMVGEICRQLTIHTQLEEEIFYPAVRDAIKDKFIMDEADVEHSVAKALIAELEAMEPTQDHYDAKVIVLGESVAHHIKEEEDEIFPKATKAKIDTIALGAELTQRKQELLAEKKGEESTKAKKPKSH